jgi:hypothetical protein
MNAKVTGTITEIKDTEQITPQFSKRVFYLEDEERENTYSLEMHYQDANWLNSFHIGDLVTCEIHIRGRAWSKNGKSGVINTLQCIRIENA